MKRKIIKSGDGSPTIYVESLREHYHSTFGAVRESEHIFINSGLKKLQKTNYNILEVGFGTGLNTFLTLINNNSENRVHYYTIEKYPLLKKEWILLKYTDNPGWEEYFRKIHSLPWESWNEVKPGFFLFKCKIDLKEFHPPDNQDLIYFDAFAPGVQPELWSFSIFQKLYNCLNPGGILVTYSVKGSVKRAMKDCGFNIEKLPGPMGKRHILRAYR